MLVNTLELLQEARRRNVAVGAFNTYNLEFMRAIMTAAEKVSAHPERKQGRPVLVGGAKRQDMSDLMLALGKQSIRSYPG